MPHATPTDERENHGARLVGSDRVIAVLMTLAEHPQGISLDELATSLASSKPTVHRALATLRRAGLADLLERGVYVLGDEYLRLAFHNLDGRPDTLRIQPLLEELASTHGETVHYAVLSGVEIVYRAKMDPPQGAVRLTSMVGGRNPAHSTAVGKALLSARLLTLSDVGEWVGGRTLEQKTPATLSSAQALFRELEVTRQRGYGVDDQENEVGVNCVAIPIYLDGSPRPSGAISISAVRFRCPLQRLVESVPEFRRVIVAHLGESAVQGSR